ncbi:MAG: hypothetical protein K2G01_04725, partial [Paramuribaculum sp.]|nr:hypothetical protein [Paramuribaculum sp.]
MKANSKQSEIKFNTYRQVSLSTTMKKQACPMFHHSTFGGNPIIHNGSTLKIHGAVAVAVDLCQHTTNTTEATTASTMHITKFFIWSLQVFHKNATEDHANLIILQDLGKLKQFNMRHIILTDKPEVAASLLPLTFTRPISELLLGIMTLRQKWEMLLEGDYSY